MPLPAECWIRYFRPAPSVRALARSFRTTRNWWYRGPDLRLALPAGLLVLLLDELGVVLQDVGEARGGEDVFPEVVGLEAVLSQALRRVAGAVVPALVERQEPRRLALEVGAEVHLLLVHREVRHAAPQLEEFLPGLAVPLVLLDGVFDGLLGEAVLQLEGGQGQAVDEQRQVEGAPGLVVAVVELPGDAEAVRGVLLHGLRVVRRRRAVEQLDVVPLVLEAVPQHVDGAVLADLPLEPGQELAPGRAVGLQLEGLGDLRLSGHEEAPELHQVYAVARVVVPRATQQPPRAAGHRSRSLRRLVLRHQGLRAAGHGADDGGFEAVFAGVGGTLPRLS